MMETKINIDKIKILWGLLIFSIAIFAVILTLAIYKSKKINSRPEVSKTIENDGQIAQFPDELRQIPPNTCPQSYDGKFFILNGKRVGADPDQSEWIHESCPDIPGQTFSEHGKEYFVKTGEIDGPQPNGTIFTDQIFHSLTISPSDSDVVFLGTEGNGAFKSVDGGKSWAWLRQGFLIGKACDSTQMTYGKIYDMAINPRNEDIIYAAVTCGPELPEKSVGGVYKSTDGGLNWTQKIADLPNTGVDSIILDSENPEIIYIGTNGEKPEPTGEILPGGIFKSMDGGETWRTLPIPEKGKTNRFDSMIFKSGNLFAVGLKFTDSNNHRLPDRENSIGLIESSDGGQNWKIINPAGAFIESFDVSNDGKSIIAAQEENYGFQSFDGGQSWKKISISKSIRIDSSDENIIFSGNLYKSDRNMAGKTRVLIPEKNAWVSDIEIFASDPDIIYAVTPGYMIYKSTDGGNKFSKIANLRDWINNQINVSTVKRMDQGL